MDGSYSRRADVILFVIALMVYEDLDLCLVLDFTPEDDTRTPRDILEILGKRIRKEFPHLYVQYKTHARIPIIKVFARRHVGGGPGAKWNRFNADISVGNLLAIHNTRLVKAYTQVDDRFRYLVLFCESSLIYIVFGCHRVGLELMCAQ